MEPCYNSTMPEPVDLSSRIEAQLPRDLAALMHLAAQEAAYTGLRLYLVGGGVRDLLLDRPTLDLDMVVEGDATPLARKVASACKAKLTVHAAFNTAKVQWGQWTVDFATARTETYSRPGALPQVKPGTIKTDLFRRDLTINAMAVELTKERWGRLIDLYDGVADLDNRIIRVLHDRSFIDDATRMWRAVRYEQRLAFHLDRHTKALLIRDLDMLGTISGDRIRHELDLVLNEQFPEKALRRAADLGILARLHPILEADAWLARKYRQARTAVGDGTLVAQYLGLLVYRLSAGATEEIVDYLRLPRGSAHVLSDVMTLRSRLKDLARPGLMPSEIYRLVDGVSPVAVSCCQLASDSPLVRRRLSLYLSKLRKTKSSLTGSDLIELGFPQGPRLKGVLTRLMDARLDGKVRTRDDEVRLARGLLGFDEPE